MSNEKREVIFTTNVSSQLGNGSLKIDQYENQTKLTDEEWNKLKESLDITSKPTSNVKIDGGGLRLNAGKLRMDLVPTTSIRALARVMGYGANKYAAFNWARGMQFSIVTGCLLRHLTAWMDGEDHDPESGLSHLDHVIANVAFLIHYSEHYKAGDDRFKLPKKE